MSNIFSQTTNNVWTNTTDNEWTYLGLDPAWIDFKSTYGDQCKKLYYCTLTGDGEDPVLSDLEIPISSFQARLRYGDPTYLSVIVPNIDDYSADITARSNGDLKVEMAWILNDVEQYRETLVIVDLESIATNQGTKNQSINLSGHRTISFPSHYIEEDTQKGIMFRALQANGKIRLRITPPELYLKAGDLVKFGEDEFIVGDIAHTVSLTGQTTDVTEA